MTTASCFETGARRGRLIVRELPPSGSSSGLAAHFHLEALEESGKRGGSTGMVTLHEVAPHVPEMVEDLLAFDTLGDDLAAERVGELDRRVDHDSIALRGVQHGHEASVDLDLGSRDPAQIFEGREARAVIVDRQLDPDV